MNSKKGQVLLIVIMLLATVLTVVLAVSFRSVSDSQTAKLEEETQKALAGAEAGINAVLQSDTAVDLSSLNVSSGITGAASVDTSPYPTFLTPVLQKDEQYTLYVSDYPNFANPINSSLTFYFSPKSSADCSSRNASALELTIVSQTNVVTKKLIEPCSSGKVIGTSDLPTTTGGAFATYEFAYKTSSPLSVSSSKVIIVRSLYGSTAVGIDSGAVNLPIQGKTVNSQARSSTGVSKKVQLFQSYPQVPAEFFVTSF